MLTETSGKPRITLIRLVLRHPDLFYNQDWYYDEEFAHKPLQDGELKSAVAIAYDWLGRQNFRLWDALYHRYIWTADTDDNGNRIYVGGYSLGRKQGLQIHRHLANPEVEEYVLY